MATSTRNGFVAADLEESIAAPGTGIGVFGPTCDVIAATVDASITVAVIYHHFLDN